jgi:cephalosporin-C deacetylase
VAPPEEPAEVPVPATGTLTARLDVMPRPAPLDRLECLVISHDADHVFPANDTPRFSVRLTNANPEAVAVVVRSEVKSYAGQSVGSASATETLEPGERRTLPLRYERLEPGFYDLAVTAALPDGSERRTELTFGTQPDRIRPSPYRERDFRAFWQNTLAELHAVPLDPVVTPDSTRSTPGVRVYKVRYASLGAPPRRVYGWYCAPATPGRHAALLVLPGYGDGPVGPPVSLAERGYAALAIQVREHDVENGAYQQPARYMTEGIGAAETYVYRFIYAHCVRGIDFLAAREEVDAERIGVMGGSQGGALSVVTAALDRRVRVATPDVPFLCHFPVAVEVAGSPYREIAEYLRAQPERRAETFRVLSYFDVLNHAPDVRCPIVWSAALRDRVCPAPTIVAAYNQVPGRRPKEIYFLPFTGHATTPAYGKIRADFLDTVLRPDVVADSQKGKQ